MVYDMLWYAMTNDNQILCHEIVYNAMSFQCLNQSLDNILCYSV